MGWQDDLARLLEETGGNVAGSAVGQAVGGVAGPVLSSGPAQAAFNFMDLPGQTVRGGLGEAYALAHGQGVIDWNQAQANTGQRISAIGQQDWGPFGILKKPTEVAANLIIDPVNYLGFGAGTAIARGAEGAGLLAREAGRPILARGLETGGTMARGSQFLWNDAGQAVLEGGRVPAGIRAAGVDIPFPLAGRDIGIQPAVRKAAGAVNRLPFRPLDLAPEFLARQENDAIKHMTASMEAANGITPPARQPVSSIFDTAAPPQAPHPHPPGSAPDVVYQAGIRGWLRMHHPKLGIVPGMRGQDYWRDPSKVRLTDQHVSDMAAIGVAAMQRVTDEGGMFPSVMRATKGTQQMRAGIVEKFGPGIEPFIPLVEKRMREQMLEQGMNPDVMMPASRHFLPHGWSKGVMSNRRLEAISAKVAKETITREQGMAEIARYPKDIQAIDAAAAHGAGLLSLYRQGDQSAYTQFLPGGAYFPQGLESTRSNARVIIPENFTKDVWSGTGPLNIDLTAQAHEMLGVGQPFGSNREAWNTYMKQQLPGIADDELNTLAGMSQDMLYHAYVNAAHPISGGARGAERIFKATVNGELDPNLMKSKGGKLADTAKKISSEKQGEIGGMIPNLTELMGIYHDGITTPAGWGTARDYFPRAVREITRVVGAGNYEDAQVLIHALALTSTGTDVTRNADLALRVLSEWKFGSEETLRSQFGLSGADFDKIMKEGLLRKDLIPQQQRSLSKAFTQFATLREGKQPITATVQGGPKTHSYAGSFLADLWRQHITTALGQTEMGKNALKAFNDALSVFAWDRHHNRIDQGATGVNAIEAFLNRERGILAARGAGLSPEEAQSAGWLWVRGRQGLISPIRGDGDTAQALRAAIEKTWNHAPDTEESWSAVIERLAQEKGLTQDEAIDQAYDLVRQHVFYGMLKKSLAKPDVQTALEAAGIGVDLTSLKDDVLGLMQRGAHGLHPSEWANPLGTVASPGGLSETLSQAPPGQVLQFQDGSWVPATAGHGVPIASGKSFKVGQVQSYRKSLEGLLNRGVVSDLFDPSSGVDNTSRLGIGLVQDGNELRPAVFALTEDPGAAAAGASRSELRRVHNLAAGDGISVPGSTPNRHLPGLLDEISGPGTPNVRPGLDQARARGVTMMEMDTVNPWSILQRKIINPLMDAYARVSLKEGSTQLAGKDLGNIHAPDFPEKMVGAAPRHSDLLSDSDNAVANQTLADGRTYKDFYVREKMTAQQDLASLKASGITWRADSTLDERLELVKGNPKLTKIIRDWHKKGIDLLYAGDPSTAATSSLIAQKAIDRGEKVARQGNYALFRAAWGEVAMFSPKNIAGNLFGNWIMNAMDGISPTLNWKNYYAAYKLAQGGAETTTRAEALASLVSAPESQKWGIPQPQELLRGGIRGLTSSSTRVTPSAVGELVAKATRSKALGRKIGTPFIIRNDWAQAVDTTARDAAWKSEIKSVMEGAMTDFEAEVASLGAGIPGFEFSVLHGINVPPGGLSPGGLKQHFMELGLSDGQSTHLANRYANLQTKARSAGIARMNKTQFSYDYTNADVIISKVVPFHYWLSRALRYYGESAIRHPFLALNYMKAMDGIDEAQNDPGLSARQQGFLRIMGTPLGFTLLMNPDAFLGVVNVFNLDSSYEPDGQTSLGGAIMWAKDRGFGMLPWIDGTLNMMGLYGNTFEPDLLGIRHKALVGATINFARAHLGLDPASAPYADAMGQLRYSVSSFVSAFTPDWLSQPVPPRVGGSSQEASLDVIIEAQVVANNPGITNGDLLTIMTDPDNPEYARAYQQAADAGIVQQLLNFTLPTNFRMRSDVKDQLAAEISTTYEAAQAAGVAPWDFAPTQGDLTFRAKYKALTGHEWTPGSYEDAKTKYDLIRAPNEAKPFIIDNAAYQNLGTPKQQRRFDTYWALRNGSDPRTAGLAEEARKEIALEWADAHHANEAINETYQLRDAFEASHPEFKEFKDWQGRVSNLAAQYGGNLAEYRRRASQQNPNAAKYFQASLERVMQTYPQEQWPAELDKDTISAAAFNAITGKGTNRQNPGPFPGVPPVDFTLPSMEPPAPPASVGSYPPDWVTALHGLRTSSPTTFGV